jgi:hypothetical protein
MFKKLFTHIKILTAGLVLGASSLIALPAYSQSNLLDRDNTRLGGSNLDLDNPPIIRQTPGIPSSNGSATYPYGSRINRSGWISTPRGQLVYPNVGIDNGDGSTTYYYQDGSRVTIDKTKLPSSGTLLR